MYYGIDGCKAGWLAIGLSADGVADIQILPQFSGVASLLDEAELILVDIPIGLRSGGSKERLCDTAARQAIKPRGSSVFPAPARSATYKTTYESASAENDKRLGRKLSQQTWAIVPKIREVDEYLRDVPPRQVIREMHPEVCFWALNNFMPLAHSKKTADGQGERLRLLTNRLPGAQQLFEQVRERFPYKRQAADDDILDAMAGAVTGSFSRGLLTLPKAPEFDQDGLPMEMVYGDW